MMGMILNCEPKQLSLKDDGQIYFQPDASNPLPGAPVAQLVKGETILQPDVQFFLPEAENNDDTKTFVSNWVKAHLCTVLSPLVAMLDGTDTPEPVQNIFIKLFQNLGIVKRAELDELIAQLDAEHRKLIRAKKVKLGPVLVFLPELNKPAAVRVRGLLWALFNDQSLPAPCPRDGAVSVKIDPATANTEFYQMIGYPLYADRAIRIDMLDRVISAIYDSADKGKFRAQHAFAEWMGCGIQDMYAILSAMGHKQIEKPAIAEGEVAVSETVVSEAVESVPASEVSADDVKSEPVQAEAATSETATPTPAPAPKAKPELDEFFLRRGQAHKDNARKEGARRPHFNKAHAGAAHAGDESSSKQRHFTKPDREKFAGKNNNASFDKSDKKSDKFGKFNAPKSGERFDRNDDRGGKFKHGKSKHQSRDNNRNDEPRVYSAAAKETDNPFAILGLLKSK